MSTPTTHKCENCGQLLQAHEVSTHYLDCPKRPKHTPNKPGRKPKPKIVEIKEEEDMQAPDVISMDLIKKIASGNFKPEVVAAEIGFECVLCEGTQIVPDGFNLGAHQVFPVCDNCKSDLKEIILTKRKKDELH